jgi:hypothetical protein
MVVYKIFVSLEIYDYSRRWFATPPLYPKELALTSPTSGSPSVGIIHSSTQATSFFYKMFVNDKIGGIRKDEILQ